jgi:hypothetical protein
VIYQKKYIVLYEDQHCFPRIRKQTKPQLSFRPILPSTTPHTRHAPQVKAPMSDDDLLTCATADVFLSPSVKQSSNLSGLPCFPSLRPSLRSPDGYGSGSPAAAERVRGATASACATTAEFLQRTASYELCPVSWSSQERLI